MRKREKNQSGALSTKIVTVIGFALTATLATGISYVGLSSLGLITNVSAGSASDFCVTAVWIDEPDISAQRGNCGGLINPPDVVVPPGDSDNSAVLATYTCGSAEQKVTQKMQNHSDANLALMQSGHEDEMTPYPDEGWKIILDPASVYGAPARGVFFTTDGSASYLNNQGYSMIIVIGNQCEALKYNAAGQVHSDNGPAAISSNSAGIYDESYIQNDVETRIDGPSSIRYDKLNNVIGRTFTIDGKIISSKESWIAAGGLPEGWSTPL